MCKIRQSLPYFTHQRRGVVVDVSRPERAFLPSMEGPVLMVLAGTTLPLRMSELHRMASKGSLGGVRHALERLVEQGVVHRVPGGYSLNREHLASPAVVLLAGMRPELLRRIGEISDAWDTTPLLLGVFGSFARRDGDSGSDIDLLLVTKAKDADEQAGELSGRVRTWTGNQCHVMALTPTDISRMRRNKEGILKEWDRDLELIRGNSDVLKGRS